MKRLTLAGTNQKLYSQTMTLGEWMDIWLEVYMKNNLKQSTYVSYEGYVRKHYKPVLGQVRLTELVPQMLQQFYNYKVEAEGLSPKTIVNMNLCLHKCLDQATTDQRIYPIRFTPMEGGYTVTAPDFPMVSFYVPSMEEGIAQAKEELREMLAGMVYPPLPSQLRSSPMGLGEFKMQIAV